MHPLRTTLGVLTFSPLLLSQSIACRNAPFVIQAELRSQCPSWNYSLGHIAKRFSTSSIFRSNPQIKFSYRIAASFCAKNLKFVPSSDAFVYDHPERNRDPPYTGGKSSGQDAFFAAEYEGPDGAGAAFGVADGVGGWSDSGIDSADFSHGLCRKMAAAAVLGPQKGLLAHMSPKALLNHAYQQLVEEGKIAGGGSTACLAIATQDGNLTVAKYNPYAKLTCSGTETADPRTQSGRFRVRAIAPRRDCPLLQPPNACLQYPISAFNRTA